MLSVDLHGGNKKVFAIEHAEVAGFVNDVDIFSMAFFNFFLFFSPSKVLGPVRQGTSPGSYILFVVLVDEFVSVSNAHETIVLG